MDSRKEFEEKVLNPIKTKGLVISRIPKSTRDEFIKFAEEYYADDYGMLLLELWNRYKEYQNILQGMDIKLNYLIELVGAKQTRPEEEKSTKRMLSGREIVVDKKSRKEVENG